jgi:FtsH-binding integral membrane protein
MSYSLDYPVRVDMAPADARASFMRRTYAHLAGAVLAFIGACYVLLHIPGIEKVIFPMLSSQLSWLLVVGAFVGVSMLANSWARSDNPPAVQYIGLGMFVLAEAVIFLPILYIAEHNFSGVIQSAAIMTLAVFAGLTAAVFLTGKDYSFLGPIVSIGGFLALGAIIVSMVVGFNLGIFFCYVMVGLMCASIIYQTSNIVHQYNTNQHVAAALGLFASVATLFYYILYIAMASSRD